MFQLVFDLLKILIFGPSSLQEDHDEVAEQAMMAWHLEDVLELHGVPVQLCSRVSRQVLLFAVNDQARRGGSIEEAMDRVLDDMRVPVGAVRATAQLMLELREAGIEFSSHRDVIAWLSYRLKVLRSHHKRANTRKTVMEMLREDIGSRRIFSVSELYLEYVQDRLRHLQIDPQVKLTALELGLEYAFSHGLPVMEGLDSFFAEHDLDERLSEAATEVPSMTFVARIVH